MDHKLMLDTPPSPPAPNLRTVLAEVRQKEEELAKERGFLASEAGASSASALQALQTQVRL